MSNTSVPPLRDAILLVAGTGSRLSPLTDDCPKCLLDVGNASLLVRLLRQLAQLGVARVTLATGYLAERIDEALHGIDGLPEVRLAYNPHFASTNNAVSCLTALEHVAPQPFLLCDGDVLMQSPDILASLIADPRENLLAMVVRDDMGAEEMKVRLAADALDAPVVALSKQLEPSTCLGESLGIQKIGGATTQALLERLRELDAHGRKCLYYEDVFARLIDEGHPFHVLPVAPDAWTEIDTLDDLEHARRLQASWQG